MAFASWRTWSTSQVVTAAELNQDIRDNGNALFPDEDNAASWSPTLEGSVTNPTTSTNEGRTYRIGALQFVFARFVLSAAGSGNYLVSLPVASSGITGSGSLGSGQALGSWQARDDSAGPASEGGTVLLDASDNFWFHLADNTLVNVVGNTVPWNWASGDVLTFQAVYPIA